MSKLNEIESAFSVSSTTPHGTQLYTTKTVLPPPPHQVSSQGQRSLASAQRVEPGILTWAHRSQLVCTWAYLAQRREGGHDNYFQGCGKHNLRWLPMSHALLLGMGGTVFYSTEYGKKWRDITPLISLLYMANAIPMIMFHCKRLCLWRLERDILPLALRKQAVGTGSSTWQTVGGLHRWKQALGNGQQ